ncbi:MAG TPA: aspartyl-phosphate phosphatase Spo0E family protein [Bacillales bacterium]|nr:aspartyl-phosphate phosphatase Spo0E family protein [Bacillales bacterium]
MKNYKSKEELLLKKIEDTRQKMLKTSTLYPLHSYEVVTISVELDNLLNEWESLYGKIEKQKF